MQLLRDHPWPVALGLFGWVAALLALAGSASREVGRGVPAMRTGSPGRGGAAEVRMVARPVLTTVLAALLAIALLLAVSRASDGRAPGAAGLNGPSRPAGATRSAATYRGGELDLRARGDLPDTPLYAVPRDSPGLWKSGHLDAYTGHSWLVVDRGGPSVLGTGDVRVQADPGDPAVAGRAVRRHLVTPQDPQALLVIAPGVPSRVRLPAARTLSGSPGTGLVVTDPDGVPRAAPFEVTSSARSDADDPTSTARLRAARGADPDDPRWLALPPTVPQRVLDLGRRLVDGRPTRLDAVRAVEGYLRANARYTLDSPVPPLGADAVEDFLFVSREGFCEQFASAEVVLLRAAGIPARPAVGFAAGVEGKAGTRTLRAEDAHAWAEVWLPGQGWVSSDPTAGSTVAQDPVGQAKSWAQRHWLLLLVLVAGLLVLAAAGFWVLGRRRRTPGRSASHVAAWSEAGPLLDAFDRLEAALAVTGRPRAQAESLTRLGDRLAEHPGAAAALSVLERTAFAAGVPGTDERRQAVEALDRTTARLLVEPGRVSPAGPSATALR